MNRYASFLMVAALTGCSPAPEPAGAPQALASTPSASPLVSPSASSPPPAAHLPTGESSGIPPRFRGTYAVDGPACAQPGHESRLVLSGQDIRFHESSGSILHSRVDGSTLTLTARLTGEGQVHDATYHFALSDTGLELRDLDYGMTRVRCP